MAEQSSFTVEQLIESADRFDVPEVQRLFVADHDWVIELIDSLWRGIGVGSLLLRDRQLDQIGPRYQTSSNASWWLLDGQQRSTGILAAFGIRPPWIPAPIWTTMRGEDKEVSVELGADGSLRFVSAMLGNRNAIRLRDLLNIPEGGVARTIQDLTGTSPDGAVVERLTTLMLTLRRASIKVDWQGGELDVVSDAIQRHSRKSKFTTAREQHELGRLSLSCVGLRRDVFDPVVAECAAAGFPRALSVKVIFDVMRLMFPRPARRNLGNDPERLRQEAYRAAAGARAAADYLHRCGVADDTLLPQRHAAFVLATLFAKFPHAAAQDFPRRWLVHATATSRFGSNHGNLAPGDAGAITQAHSLANAERALASRMPAGPLARNFEDDLTTGHRSVGPIGTLFAMACAAQVNGSVSDLSDSNVVVGDPRLRLHPLWRHSPGVGRRALAAYALMTDRTAAVIDACGGWGPAAYRELRCSDRALHAQQIPRAGSGNVEEAIQHRTPAITRMIDVLLADAGALRDEEPSNLYVLGDRVPVAS